MYEVDEYTVSLLHFDGGLTDETGKVWTAQNGAAINTTQSKFGESSLYLNGTNQYLATLGSTDFDFGSGDFTIDWWEYRTATNANVTIFTRDYTVAMGEYLPYQIGASDGAIVCVNISSGNTAWDIADARLWGL